MGYATLLGEHRCAQAQLVIIDSLERFHGPCPSEEWVVHVTYIVAKGIPVTTAACCWGAFGDLREIPHSNFVEHIPATEQNVELDFDEGFQLRHKHAVRAVRACQGHWKVKKTKSNVTRPALLRPAPAGGGTSGSRAPACGGGSRSSSSGLESSAPASGGQIQAKGKKVVVAPVSSLEDLWQLLQMLRRIRNSKGAPLIWRAERVGM